MELSNEQISIINYVKQGYSNLEIAGKLGYSPDTIKKKLCKIYKIFNVRGRIALVNHLIKQSK